MFSNLIFDKSLEEFFQFANRNFIIPQIICSGNIGNHLKDEGNYLASVPGEIDTISFLPKSKIDKVEDPWTQSRVKIKIGRFIKKFFSDFSMTNWKITDAEIEKFVNSYKSYFSQDPTKLKVVTGSDISKYYLQDNYYQYDVGRSNTGGGGIGGFFNYIDTNGTSQQILQNTPGAVGRYCMRENSYQNNQYSLYTFSQVGICNPS